LRKAYLIIPKRYYDDLDEALALAENVDYKVIKIWRTRYLRRIGKGLLKEIQKEASIDKPDTIIFYGEIAPSTAFELMKSTRARVIDRVQLILEIFIAHAGSKEAKLQIEMAKVKYEIPLVREFIRRSKMGELPGFLGPGGYAIDAYYRHLTRRLAKLKEELRRLREIRRTRLEKRAKEGLKHVSIVGYASAGKTTLFNALTGLSKPTGPEYFTTLHPKRSAINIDGTKVVLVDTVGFIKNVPPTLIEAFYSTLEEITFSDLILLVVDGTDPPSKIKEKVVAGLGTLAEIGASGKGLVAVLNKIDVLNNEEVSAKLNLLNEVLKDANVLGIVPVSAKKGVNLELLLKMIKYALMGEEKDLDNESMEAVRQGLRSEIRA
jgi:GTP-binding protein HflX